MQHWEKIAERWRHVGAPLRPCPADVAHFSDLLGLRQAKALRVLILGVTPELFALNWPAGTVVKAVDRSPEMIGALWPGRPEAAVQADWARMPFEDASFDCVLCDGGLHLQSYPSGHQALVNSITRVLSPGGRFLVRLFALPMRPERTEAILEDLDGGGIPNFHGFKLRLAMALQTSSEAGIVLDRVHRYVVESAGGPAHIAQKTGWPAAEVATIDSYRNSTNTYHFLTEPDSITILTSSGGLRLESRCENVYPLGDRCPVLALRKEDPR